MEWIIVTKVRNQWPDITKILEKFGFVTVVEIKLFQTISNF